MPDGGGRRQIAQHLLAEPAQQQARCLIGGDAAALQIKQFVLLQPTDGGAMGAAHIVGDDFQLRLGVDPRPIGKQQAAAELGRIGALGSARHPHRAIEHTAARLLGHHFVQLLEPPLRPGEHHLAVGVGDAATAHVLQTPQPGEGSAGDLHHPGLQAPQSPAGAHAGEGIGALGILRHGQVGEQHGVRPPLRHNSVVQGGAGAEARFHHHRGETGPGGPMHLHQLQAGPGIEDQQQPQGQHAGAGAGVTDELQRGGHRTGDTQGEHGAGTGLVEQHGPVLTAACGGEGLAEGLLDLPHPHRLEPRGEALGIKGIGPLLQAQPQRAGGGTGPGARGAEGVWREQGGRNRLQGPQIGEAPGLLATGGQRLGPQAIPAPTTHRGKNAGDIGRIRRPGVWQGGEQRRAPGVRGQPGGPGRVEGSGEHQATSTGVGCQRASSSSTQS